ncbi:MAG: hypothetical protein JOZ64_09965 [Solirubrobacterales bacterium]|nr:hypothetical protein [Solirubrobacterales bacterium]
MAVEYPQLEITSRQQWRGWLAAHHAISKGVWVITHKKTGGADHVAYHDIAEEAVAFGWVDSQPRKLDEHRSQLLLTPRNPKSNWSRVNKTRVEKLEKTGQMTDAGRAALTLAKETGTWTALDTVENLEEPDDWPSAGSRIRACPVCGRLPAAGRERHDDHVCAACRGLPASAPRTRPQAARPRRLRRRFAARLDTIAPSSSRSS